MQCPKCGREHRPLNPANPVNCRCGTRFILRDGEVAVLRIGTADPAAPRTTLGRKPELTTWEQKQLFGDEDPSLWGNKIAEFTKLYGIPPCGGCDQRRKWINNFHAWLRGDGKVASTDSGG